MEDGLVRIYESLVDAERARDAVLRAGFPASRVQLTTNADEAGQVEGHLAVDGTSDAAPVDDDADVADAVRRGVFVLAVEAHGAEEHHRVTRLLEDLGGVDVDERTIGGAV